ncbi:hypothetical protein [Aerophototrophica crusticola]|uniref:hypothetical protein n=1 Tax=Aerophototrophica crusticola TaxID=1709002 RepID=UPI0009515EFA
MRRGVFPGAPARFFRRPALFARAVNLVANGVLIYAIFYGVLWVLAVKVGLLAQVALRWLDGIPDLVEGVLAPMGLSFLAAFLAHAGLRLTLKHLRLKLSVPEANASWVFLAVLTLLAFSGGFGRFFDTPETMPLTAPAIVLGAWGGVALRRRVRL